MNISLKKIISYLKKQKSIFFLVAGAILIYMVFASTDAGNSGDEHYNHDQAALVYKYITTFGKDSSYVNPALPLQKYYGQSFDNLVYIFNKNLGIEDYYKSRHIFNAASGWLLMLFTALIASLLFGWRAGIISLILIFFSPRILGHSWNNPKDIPFAMTYSFTIYFIFLFIKALPKISKRNLLFITLGIAASISIRIGGLIIIPYLFLYVGVYYLTEKNFYSKQGFSKALKIAGILILVSIFGYFIGLLLWPYGLENPFKNPIEALKQMTNYDVGLNQLFEGKITMSQDLPWYYGIKYIVITTPIVILIGFLTFLVTIPFRKDSKNNYLFYSFLIFAFLFPIAYTIYKNSNLYGGWRHLLWTYSPIVVLAAGGIDYFINKKNNYIKYGSILLLLILLINPVRHTFKNHPYEYIYYNQLVGGVNGAYGNYEMDYYYHGLKGASDWFIKNELPNLSDTDTIIMATDHSRIAEYFFRKYPNIKVIYSRYYGRSMLDWDYAIWTNTHIEPYQLKNNLWPPRENLYSVMVDNIPIAAVTKRISKEDFKGFEAYHKNQINEAKTHFQNFLKAYPENEEAYEGLARTYLAERNYEKALELADSSLMYNSREIGSYYVKSVAYNNQKKYNEAISMAQNCLDIKEAFADAHFQKGYALEKLNKADEAMKEFNVAIKHNKEHYGAFMQLGDMAINYKKYKDAIEKIYNKVLTFNKNDLGATTKIALCYYFLGNQEKAEEILHSIPSKNQNDLNVVKLKCRMEIDKRNMVNATRLLHMARNINFDSELFVVRSKFSLANNETAKAKEYIDKAVELDANNREAKDLLKQFQSIKKPIANQNQPQSIMTQKEDKSKKQEKVDLFDF